MMYKAKTNILFFSIDVNLNFEVDIVNVKTKSEMPLLIHFKSSQKHLIGEKH